MVSVPRVAERLLASVSYGDFTKFVRFLFVCFLWVVWGEQSCLVNQAFELQGPRYSCFCSQIADTVDCANTSGCFVLFCFVIVVGFFVCFSRRGLCGYPGTYFTEPIGLKLKDLPTSVS